MVELLEEMYGDVAGGLVVKTKKTGGEDEKHRELDNHGPGVII